MTQSTSILALSMKATGALTAERFVNQRGAQSGAGTSALGVARTDALVGTLVAVDVLGTAIVQTGGAIAEGDAVASDATGCAVVWAAGATQVGVAMQASAAAGQRIEVFLLPNAA